MRVICQLFVFEYFSLLANAGDMNSFMRENVGDDENENENENEEQDKNKTRRDEDDDDDDDGDDEAHSFFSLHLRLLVRVDGRRGDDDQKWEYFFLIFFFSAKKQNIWRIEKNV